MDFRSTCSIAIWQRTRKFNSEAYAHIRTLRRNPYQRPMSLPKVLIN